MTGTLSRAAALWTLCYGRYCRRPLFRKHRPMPSEARSEPQCRSDYDSALRQHSAGRHGLAAMSAEKYVEPLLGLSKRRARRRKRRRNPRPSAAGSPPQRQSPSRAVAPKEESAAPPARPAAEAAAAGASQGSHRDNQKPEQCATLPRSAAPAAPTIRGFAPACRPAVPRRCSAWKRTSRESRQLARRPSPP